MWDGVPITAIKRTFVRHAEECNLPDFTPGTIPHFMATMVRRQKPPVDKEQGDVWLGHDEKRAANAYESFDPDYLADCMQAAEQVIADLQKHTKRPLFACKTGFQGTGGGKEIGLKALYPWVRMVGVTGIEPVTPTMST